MRLRVGIVGVLALTAALFSVVGLSPANAVTPPGVLGTRLPVPADASASPNPEITGVSCGAPGFCVAVGTYLPANSSSNTGLIETLSGGIWTASRSPFPAGAYGAGFGGLQGVSCVGTSTCAAYGMYGTSPSADGYMALIRSGGVWTAQSIGVPGGGTFAQDWSDGAPAIGGVGCSGVGACVLVGNYRTGTQPSYLRGWTNVFHAGHWGGAMITPTPVDTTGQATWLKCCRLRRRALPGSGDVLQPGWG